MWGDEVASVYDANSSAMFAPSVLNPTVALLEELAQGGAALEFAAGTGRVALPLSAREVVVHGVELSPPIAARLAEKPPDHRIGSARERLADAAVRNAW